jgi:hypothetical protein
LSGDSSPRPFDNPRKRPLHHLKTVAHNQQTTFRCPEFHAQGSFKLARNDSMTVLEAYLQLVPNESQWFFKFAIRANFRRAISNQALDVGSGLFVGYQAS